MSKPTFVCVHGAWHSRKCFDHIKTILSDRGYDCICPSLPSTGRDNYPTDYDFTEDVKAIRAPIIDLVKDKDVIVVLHSYGGIFYIVAFIVPEGFQHSPPGTRDSMIPVMKTDFKVSITHLSCIIPSSY